MFCPACKSDRVRVLDKGIKKIMRFLQGNNRFYCRDCSTTWREEDPTRFRKLKRKHRHAFE